MKIIPVRKPRTVREWIASKLVDLARWISPASEDVKAFWLQLILDREIYGNAIVRMSPKKYISFPSGSEVTIVQPDGNVVKFKKGVKKNGKKKSK